MPWAASRMSWGWHVVTSLTYPMPRCHALTSCHPHCTSSSLQGQSAYTSIISLGCLLIESSHLSMTLTSSRYHHHSTTSTNIHSCFFIISSLSTLTTTAHYSQAAKPADSRKLLSSKEKKKHDSKMSCTSILPVWSRGCILIILH